MGGYNPATQQFLELGAKGQAEGASAYQHSQDKQAALKQLLMGKQIDQEKYKTQLDADSNKMMEMYGGKTPAEAAQNAAASGRSGAVGSLKFGAEPVDRSAGNTAKYESKAMKDAGDFYNKHVTDLKKQAEASESFYKNVSERPTISLGAAKAALINSYGFSRYNEQEAATNLQSTWDKLGASAINWTGGAESQLSDAQKRDVLGALKHRLSTINSDHESLKDTAASTYARQSAIGGSKGSPDDFLKTLPQTHQKFFSDIASRYSEQPPAQGNLGGANAGQLGKANAGPGNQPPSLDESQKQKLLSDPNFRKKYGLPPLQAPAQQPPVTPTQNASSSNPLAQFGIGQ